MGLLNSIKTVLKKVFNRLLNDKNLYNLPKTSLNRKLSLLDVGARGGIGYPWNTANKDSLNIILAEPDPQEIELLKKNHVGEILPHALWSNENELILNINNSEGTSSILESNMDFLKKFDNSDRFKTKNKIKKLTKTIDELSLQGKISDIDFIKIDTQGGELNVLEGGINYLKDNLVGLETEIEFVEIYKNQPLFSDVETFIRQNLGLELWDIRKTYWKYSQSHYKNPTKGRLIFGDALFLRPITTLEKWLNEMEINKAKTKIQMLIISTIAYGYLDYTNAILKTNFTDNFINKEDKQLYFAHIKKLHKSIYFNNRLSMIFQPLQLLANCFKPTHQGWASVDSSNHLGSRKKGIFWF